MFIVTGGGSGIGRALACELANRGQKVLIIGRNQERLEQTAAHSTLIDICAVDLLKSDSIQFIVNTLKNIEHLDGIIHSAGMIDPIVPINNITQESWQNILTLNLTIPLLLTQSLLDKLNNARVLTIGSGAAYFPVTGWSGYCVSKSGLAMLMRCWQLEFRNKNTFFANVMPGIIATNMQTIIRQSQAMDPEKLAFFNQLFETKKLITADTVAQFLCWLLLSITPAEYIACEWDIYDVSHHHNWLVEPYRVIAFENY